MRIQNSLLVVLVLETHVGMSNMNSTDYVTVPHRHIKIDWISRGMQISLGIVEIFFLYKSDSGYAGLVASVVSIIITPLLDCYGQAARHRNE